MLSPSAKADVCDVNSLNTHYKAIYCGIRLDGNEEADEELIETLSNQFEIDEELIEHILAGTICDEVLTYDEDDQADLPESVRNACLPSGADTQQVLGAWNVFTDVRNSYEKEKVIRFSQKSLEFKFKASEQYWDGAIGPGPDAPFDLIVDLNLIEIVLFGSKATWMNDVFAFPSDDDEETGTDEAPLDSALPEDEESSDEPLFEETDDPGLSVVEDEDDDGLPPGCVPPDDPNADDGPGGSGNPLCGNGVLDVLMGETCDDGNTESGDGCSQFCQIEENGSNDQCMDPEAVTFKKPGDDGGSGGDDDGDGSGPQCPPGSVPSKLAGISGTPAGAPQEVPQNFEYPGPYLGGTLKQFPPSNRPPCGPGESPVDVTVAGETHTATDGDDEVICLPTELCGDFNAAQDFLFGEGWEDDETVANIAPAIESLFCVNVIENNRPLSPYNVNEGCIDCHITAMADALEKALQTNVSPLVNTTSAFQISSKYGPAFSFNLQTAAKSKPKFKSSNTQKNAIKKAEENIKKARDDNTVPESPVTASGNPLSRVITRNAQEEAAREAILEDTRTFKLSNQVISDQEVGGRLIPLIYQMRDSFANIQSKYEGMITSTALDEKKQCIP